MVEREEDKHQLKFKNEQDYSRFNLGLKSPKRFKSVGSSWGIQSSIVWEPFFKIYFVRKMDYASGKALDISNNLNEFVYVHLQSSQRDA